MRLLTALMLRQTPAFDANGAAAIVAPYSLLSRHSSFHVIFVFCVIVRFIIRKQENTMLNVEMLSTGDEVLHGQIVYHQCQPRWLIFHQAFRYHGEIR